MLDAPRTRASLVYGKVFVDLHATVKGPLDGLTMRGNMNLLDVYKRQVPGKGSTVTIYIPIYPVMSEGRRMKDEESGCVTTPNGNSSFPVPHSSLKNVLLIDDDRIQLI